MFFNIECEAMQCRVPYVYGFAYKAGRGEGDCADSGGNPQRLPFRRALYTMSARRSKAKFEPFTLLCDFNMMRVILPLISR